MAAPLAALLASSLFLNAGRVTRNDSFVFQAVDCLYLEGENASFPRDVWAYSTRIGVPEAGPCTFLFQVNASGAPPPPPPACTAENTTQGYDRAGFDYSSTPIASAEQCEAACCGDAHCASWVWVPRAPGPYMSCTSTSAPCCYRKTRAPVPTPSGIPGIVSGARPTGPPANVMPPPSGMRSAVPLGGVGAGSFELRADGTVHEWTVHEASPAGNAKLGTVADMLLAVRVGGVARALRTSYLGSAAGAAQGVDALTYRGSYPLSRLEVEDASLSAAAGGDARLALSAYSRFAPADLNGSAAPAVSFTLTSSNPSATSPLEVSLFLSLPLSAMDACWGDNGSPKTVVSAASPAECNAACAAADASACANWWLDRATGNCTLQSGLHLIGYRENAACGVRGRWMADALGGVGSSAGAPALTLLQSPPECTSAPAAKRSPWCGNFTLAATSDVPSGGSSSASFAAADDLGAIFSAFATSGSVGPAPGAGGVAAAFGAGAATMTLAPGATGAVTLVFAWYLPNRDYMGANLGAFYGNLFAGSNAVASELADVAEQRRVVGDINAHHAVFLAAPRSEPDWLADIAVNSFSHMRNAFHTADGRWRQFEAFDCDDMDSVHNDFQRHLPYLWAFPEVEQQKSQAWARFANTEKGFIQECMAVGCLGPPGEFDVPGGREMGDVSTIWTLGVLELYQTGAMAGSDAATAKALVQAVWPQVLGALRWQLAQTTNADAPGLPAYLVCTYDIEVLEKYPTTAYNSFLHLAMMRAVAELADIVGDAGANATARDAFARGLAGVRAQLWNASAGAFRAFSTKASPTTMPVMSDCLYGATIAHSLGLGTLWDGSAEDFASHLALEASANGNAYGLAVLTGRDGPEPFASIDQTEWGMAAPTWGYMALAGADLSVDAALEIPQRFFDNIRLRLRDTWNIAGLYSGANWTQYGADDDGQAWCTNHYGMALTHFFLHLALSGQQASLPKGTLSFAPRYAAPFSLPLLLAGTTGRVSADAAGTYTVSIAFGELSLPAGGLSVNGRAFAGAVNLQRGQSVSW